MKYRVKQTAKDQFIPQVKANILSRWGAIKHYKIGIGEFSVLYYAQDLAIVRNIDDARAVIHIYKNHLELTKIDYPIYHNEVQD